MEGDPEIQPPRRRIPKIALVCGPVHRYAESIRPGTTAPGKTIGAIYREIGEPPFA